MVHAVLRNPGRPQDTLYKSRKKAAKPVCSQAMYAKMYYVGAGAAAPVIPSIDSTGPQEQKRFMSPYAMPCQSGRARCKVDH